MRYVLVPLLMAAIPAAAAPTKPDYQSVVERLNRSGAKATVDHLSQSKQWDLVTDRIAAATLAG